MALRDGQKGKLFFCQCSNHWWNLPCVYPCIKNESHNFIWLLLPEWDVVVYRAMLHCERTLHKMGWDLSKQCEGNLILQATIITLDLPSAPHLATVNTKTHDQEQFLFKCLAETPRTAKDPSPSVCYWSQMPM